MQQGLGAVSKKKYSEARGFFSFAKEEISKIKDKKYDENKNKCLEILNFNINQTFTNKLIDKADKLICEFDYSDESIKQLQEEKQKLLMKNDHEGNVNTIKKYIETIDVLLDSAEDIKRIINSETDYNILSDAANISKKIDKHLKTDLPNEEIKQKFEEIQKTIEDIIGEYSSG